MFAHYCLLVEKQVTKPRHKTQEENLIFTLFTDTLSSPVGEFVSELQTSEIPEGLMKHGLKLTPRLHYKPLKGYLCSRPSGYAKERRGGKLGV
jgi:hypothetical protein